MDRLPTLIAALALSLLACEEKSANPAPMAGRVDAVKAQAKRGPTLEELCDKRYDAASAPAFVWPKLAGAPPAAASGWRWINVWATWCKPCVEEMPRLRQWKERMGQRVDLQFLSIDESDEVVAAYRKQHPDAPAGVRLAEAAALPGFFKSLGLDEAAPIPIHVIVDGQGKTRCVRAGAVNDADMGAIERLVAE
jgi:thiol-disulfide isomerase/thioredoxin